MDTSSSNDPEVAQLLHRLRSTLARLKGEVELAELDGHPLAAGVGESLAVAFRLLEDIELRATAGKRIHVVDDDMRLAAVTARRISSFGWIARPVESIPVDISVGDHILIDFGVLDAASDEARTTLARNGFIVMSGSVDPRNEEQAIAWGATAYLIKPIDFDRLRGLLTHR